MCIEKGCTEPAGTLWGPLWCPEHDRQRLDRVSASLEAITSGKGSEEPEVWYDHPDDAPGIDPFAKGS